MTKNKKTYTMEIHENLERISEGKLSDMGLFELSIRALMPCDIYVELKKRIELIRTLLKNGEEDTAVDVLDSLLINPKQMQNL